MKSGCNLLFCGTIVLETLKIGELSTRWCSYAENDSGTRLYINPLRLLIDLVWYSIWMSSARVTSMPQQIPRQFPKVCSGRNRRGCQSFPQTFQRRGEEVFTTARNDEIRHSADNLVLVIGISPRHAADTLPNERIQSGIKLSPVALDQASYIAHPGSSSCVCPKGNLGLFAHAKWRCQTKK